MSRLSLLRALVVGVLLIPFCCYWAQDQAIDRIFSLMVPPVALTIVVAVLNALVRRVWPRAALRSPEIVIIYVMLSVACAMSGEWMDMLAPQVYGYAIYSDVNQSYVDRFLPYLSKWLFFTDPAPLKDFHDGGKAFPVFWAALPMWMPKVLMWTVFLLLLTFAMLCINALLREQWVHQEKLSFPIVQIPLALAEEGGPGSLWRSRLMWGGFAVTFAIDMLNGFSFLYPSIPSIPIRFIGAMNEWLHTPPWNQTGWIPIGIFPYVSALGAFVPTDLLFSLLFFFVVRKAQQILAYVIGNEQGTFGGGGLVPAPPYFTEQSWGAFLGLFVTSILLARPHWKKVAQILDSGVDPTVAQGNIPYKLAFYGLIVTVLLLGAFGVLVGLPFGWVVLYIVLFLMFSVGLTRLRAQLGAPTHEMAFMGPHQLIVDAHGTMGLPPELITRTMTTFHILNRIHRTHPMPSLLEGQYAADRAKVTQRTMWWTLLLSIILGSVGGHLVHIWLGYRWTPVSWVSGDVNGVVSNLQGTPRAPNYMALGAVGIGALVVWTLDLLRFRVPGFWLHPAGYALAMNFGIDYYWFGLLLVLIAKIFLQRYWGIKGAGWLRQVAIGLILGEFAAELIWATFSMLNDRQITYSISFNGKMGWDR